jgi:hypothetical protein
VRVIFSSKWKIPEGVNLSPELNELKKSLGLGCLISKSKGEEWGVRSWFQFETKSMKKKCIFTQKCTNVKMYFLHKKVYCRKNQLLTPHLLTQIEWIKKIGIECLL